MTAVTLVAGCVSTPVNAPDAKLIVGYRWNNPPFPGFGGLSASLYPYDVKSGAAGRKFVPSGQPHIHLGISRLRDGGASYQVIDVVAGDYVLGHTEADVGDTSIDWVCPPIAFSVAPGSVTYLGDLVFDRFRFMGLQLDTASATAANKFDAIVEAKRIDGRIDYERYTNPGFMAGVPSNPCGTRGE